LNNGKDNIGKFDSKSDEGIHIGYALNGHAYQIYNRRLLTVEEFVHIVFDESNNHMLKSIEDELETSDLRIVLLKDQLIVLIQPIQILKKEQTATLELPREWRNPKDFDGRSAFMCDET